MVVHRLLTLGRIRIANIALTITRSAGLYALISRALFISPRYFASFALSMKNWFTYSTAWMPCSAATLAKSRLSILPERSSRLIVHCASEICSGATSFAQTAVKAPAAKQFASKTVVEKHLGKTACPNPTPNPLNSM